MTTLAGTIEKIIYHNEKNGYTVAKFNIMEGPDEETSTTITGKFNNPREGTYIKIKGDWTEHMIYGEQFNIESYNYDLPTSDYGLERYLSSGILPGIGEKMAKTLVDEFGNDLFDILENNPSELLRIRGIGKSKLEKIIDAYKSQKDQRDILVQLQEYNISPAIAQRLINKYGPNTVNLLLENPYQIAIDINGIGFLKADEIAQKLGFDIDDEKRILSGIVYALNECYRSGHTYMNQEDLMYLTSKLLNIDEELIEHYLSKAVIDGTIYEDYENNEPIYYPLELYKAESDAAYALSQLLATDVSNKALNIDYLISKVEKKLNLKFDKSQREAIKAAIESPVVIISGGPGTGKSATSSVLIKQRYCL